MHPISEYFNRIVVFPAFALSQDGERLAYQSSLTGSPQVWAGAVPKSGMLSYPTPITSAKDKQPHVMHPEGLQWIGNHQLICLMDRHGDEKTFIEIHDFKSGEIKSIPEVEGAREYLGFASKDRKTYFFTSNRGNPAAQGLYSYSLKTGKVECWHQHESQSAGWCGRKFYKGQLLFARSSSTMSNSLHAIHPKTKKVTELYAGGEAHLAPIGSGRGSKLLVVTNYKRQFLSLAEFDPKTKDIHYLEPDKWDVESAELSPNRKLLLVSRNVAGCSHLELYSWPSMKRQKIASPGTGIIEGLSFSESGKYAVFGLSSPVEPRNFYRIDMKTRKIQQLTDNWVSRVPKSELAMSTLVKYDSQKRQVYSWLILPKGAKRDKSLPVIVWPHGGPQYQERAQFRPIFQYFVGRGFAIWAPNPTGSTGFGRDFCSAICGQWGTADLPDMENGLAWLKNSGWINPKRIAIMGGSYGGYMTLRSLTKFPSTFKAGVDVFGVSNLLTFVKSVPADWMTYMDELVGNLERDAERLREQSPFFSLDQIDCPLMVIQGALDPRVVKAESDQVVEQLRENGREVEYVVFDDEGHGFLKLDNELKAYSAAAKFLETHL
jgi:dipeptidyl aminopeptidase/acylaminoacyl peptidase